jgi:two-component system response regulator FixJ
VIQPMLPAKMRVCLIEDDPHVSQAISTYLSSIGYRVRAFSKGADFLEFFDWTPDLDCIISDIRLPDIDGLELLRHVRGVDSNCPMIMITGHGDVSMAVTAMKIGASDFLQKPIDPGQLQLAISNAIAARKEDNFQDARARDAASRIAKLGGRHREILKLVAQGLTSKEIGSKLHLSYRTVESHRVSLMDQLDAKTLADLIKLVLLAELNNDQQ